MKKKNLTRVIYLELFIEKWFSCLGEFFNLALFTNPLILLLVFLLILRNPLLGKKDHIEITGEIFSNFIIHFIDTKNLHSVKF